MNKLIIRIIGQNRKTGTSVDSQSITEPLRSAGIRSKATRSADKISRRRPPSRPEIRPVRAPVPGSRAGAVRTSAMPAKTSAHSGKLVVAIVGIMAVFGWLIGATPDRADNQPISGKIPPDQILSASLTPPIFFFDDASDALEQTKSTVENVLSNDSVLAMTSLTAGSGMLSPDVPAKSAPSIPSKSDFFDSVKNLPDAVIEKPDGDKLEGTSPVLTGIDSKTTATAAVAPAAVAPATTEKPPKASVPVFTKNEQSFTDDQLTPVNVATVDIAPAERQLRQQAIESKNIPETSSIESTASESTASIVTVQSGDTLSGILNRYGVSIDKMPQLLTNPIVKDHLSNLEIGQEFELVQNADKQFHSLSARIDGEKRVTIRLLSNGLSIESVELPVERQLVTTSGVIEQSLYHAAEQAQIKQSTIMELSEIFQWELDFAKDIRQGDQFSLVYDKLYREGEYIRDGAILAAQFVRGGQKHTAIRYTTEEGKTGYFSPDGKSKQRTFLRHPVDVVRITSRFNPNRLHPVLHKIRAHRGVDYGAPYGSPIYATADGVVQYSGLQNAYGNTVILKHGEKFTTLYAHMSKISGKTTVGKKVSQGDVIGYVGKSGRVTGVHLHYEFRVDGVQMDPLAIELPAAEPIEQKYLTELQDLGGKMQKLMQNSQSKSLARITSERDIGADMVADNEPLAAGRLEFK